jgi:CRP-like cAMP-binding protein
MSVPSPADMIENELLAKLRASDRQGLSPHMMTFEFRAGDVLQRAGDEVVHTWFPARSAMAAFCVWNEEHGNYVEVATVGREGAIGGIVSNGNTPAFATSIVQFAGRFLRVRTAALEQAKLDSIALRHWFSRYSDCLLAQVFQSTACNATHTISQRTAKWLLSAVARTGGVEFEMTHEQLAGMLGVGRTFVTRVIRQLREENLIATRRGVFIVKDETALQKRSCACSTAVAEHFDAVLHGIYPIVGT